MKNILIASLAVLLLASTACGDWWVPARVVTAYYPTPVYAYPPPAVVYPPPAYAYPPPYVTYSPVVPAPGYWASPVPMWYGPPGVVVRGKVFIPGRPIRNTVRAVLP
jgi:hypothetical protein